MRVRVISVDGISGGVLVGRAMSAPELSSFVPSLQSTASGLQAPETRDAFTAYAFVIL